MTNNPGHDYNGLPPLGCEASPEPTEFEHTIGWLSDCLARVSAGTERAFNFSEALCSLQTETSRRHARISPHQRDQLLRSLALAHKPILHLFDASPEQPTVAQAVNAVAGLICWWAETDEERKARHKHLFADFQAYARWLRNTCHNLCLLEDIDRRANQRRTEVVAEILRRSAA